MLWRAVLLALGVTFASTCLADVDEYGKITNIVIQEVFVQIWLDGPDATSDCSGGARWSLYSSDQSFQQKLALLLAAAAQGTRVRLHHAASGGCGIFNSNRIFFMDVEYGGIPPP